MSIAASSVTLVAGFNSPVKPNTGPTGTGVFGARMISGGGVSQPLGSGARARVTDPIWGGVRRWLARRPWPAPSPAVRGRARFPTPWFKGMRSHDLGFGIDLGRFSQITAKSSVSKHRLTIGMTFCE